tara:strand:+ start:337 stop:606 length:270 start_codon:yes stop_codon:yes gene_type:complete
MSLLTTLIEPATKLLDKVIEDKDQKAKLAHELATMADKLAHEQQLAQMAINKEEAASGSLLKVVGVLSLVGSVGLLFAITLLFSLLLFL